MATFVPQTIPSNMEKWAITPNYRPADTPTTVNHYVRRGGAGDSYVGRMMPAEYLKKQEQTCMYVHEGMMDEHFRSVLKDRTPEKPTLASDLIRRDKHSAEVLSVRHNGARTAEIPNHPDLNLSFTDRDPRGVAEGPNMRKMALQSGFRSKYKDFVNDNTSDMTITGGNRSEMKVIKDFRATIAGAKKRWNWFATSQDGRATKNNIMPYTIHRRSDASKVIANQPNLRVNEMTQATRDAVTTISNEMPIGSRVTPSHKFNVADYSQARRKANKTDNDFRRLLDDVEEDQDKQKSREENTRVIAYYMSTAANKEVEFDTEVTESYDAQVGRSRTEFKDVRRGLDQAECSEINPANMIFQHYMNRPQTRTLICKDRLGRAGEVDKSQMALIKEMKAMKSGAFHFDPRLAWETEGDESKAREFKTHVYKMSGLAPRRAAADEFDLAQDTTDSTNTQDRMTSHQHTMPGGGRDTNQTAEMRDAQFMDRHGAGLGQKSKVRHYGTEDGVREEYSMTSQVRRRTFKPKMNGSKAALVGQRVSKARR